MNRYEFVKTLTPERFLQFMLSDEHSCCKHNANGLRWKTHCLGKYRYDCDGCEREFWLEEDIGEPYKPAAKSEKQLEGQLSISDWIQENKHTAGKESE